MMLQKKNVINSIIENSLLYQFFNKKMDKIDFFSASEIMNFLLSIIIFLWEKLQLIEKANNKIINFCLKNPIKKSSLLLFFLVLINPFTRNNYFGNIVSIPLCIIFLICLINIINLLEEKHKNIIMHVFLIAFSLKIIYLLATANFVLFPDEYEGYHDFGRRIAHAWLLKIPLDIPALGDELLYIHFLGGIYYVFGSHFFIGRLFNLFVHIVTGYIIYLITKSLFENKSAIASVMLFFTLFSIHVISISLLREGFLLFFTALTFLFFISLLKSLNSSSYFTSFVYLALINQFIKYVYSVRSYFESVTKFCMILAAGVYFTSKYLIKNEHKMFNRILLFSIFIIIMGSQIIYLKDKMNSIQIQFQEKINILQTQRNNLDYGNLKFYENLDISIMSKIIKYLPIGLSYAMFSPFPTKTTDTKLMVFFLGENIIWYILLQFIIIGIVFALRDRFIMSIFIIMYSSTLLIIFALVEGNIGNLLRHAIHFKAFLLIFAGHGIIKTLPENFFGKLASDKNKA